MTTPIAIVTSHQTMVEAFRAAKEHLGLSNEFCDDVGGLTKGHTDKILGPTHIKNLGPMTMDLFCEMFAVQFIMVLNVDAAKRMEARWEGRETSHVRTESARVSKSIIERAKPHVLKGFAQLGNTARNALLTGEQRSAIASKAARAKHRNRRRKQREAKTPAPIHP